MNKNNSFDIIVVGGGLAGLLQSILLAQNGIKVLCLDKQDEETAQKNPFYKRTTAISYGSHQLLKAANLWDELSPLACPIQSIEVLDGNSPTLLQFDISESVQATTADGFGWVIENHHIQNLLVKTIRSFKNTTYHSGVSVTAITHNDNNITVTTDNNQCYSAQLLIGADGRKSFVREACGIKAEEFTYNQNAIVSIIEHENSHEHIAVEHFKSSGPFAILPMTNNESGNHRSSIVWTEETTSKNSILDWSNETYKIALQQLFPDRYGAILSVSERLSYPLGYVHAHDYISDRVALIGDAAHGIHPIAGQGLNLGLRDVAALTEIIIKNKFIDIEKSLSDYQQSRRSDNMYMSAITDGMNRLFSNNYKSVRLARKIGLKLFDKIALAKNHIIGQTMGTSGHTPDIIKRGKI